MPTVTSQGVSIAELIVYVPTALVTFFVLFRHGAAKQLGWIFLSIFSVVRIIGAILQLISNANPDNTKLLEWAIILTSVGLSPLLLASLAFLKRICDETTTRVPNMRNGRAVETVKSVKGPLGLIIRIFTSRATATSRRSITIQLLHIPALIALGLAIAGGTNSASSDPSKQSTGKNETRGACVLFAVMYASLVALWSITTRDVKKMDTVQKRIYFAVFAALPFMGARVVYSLMSSFGSDRRFSMIYGDVGVRLGMATIEEFVVVFMYTVLGVVTPKAAVLENKDDASSQESGVYAQGATEYNGGSGYRPVEHHGGFESREMGYVHQQR
ncbi:uncharacterized protein BDV14DRAFT_204998 [Aspergillus stella-maris]|uniref:uncharacterized protein n=1 Tax=Aspergillus stella-maris TaxID=1810926 RepID=UPI003CCCF61A